MRYVTDHRRQGITPITILHLFRQHRCTAANASTKMMKIHHEK
ncbi:GSCOCT00014291001.2-RA-CDS, partial [Cotesia congregata]